MRFFARQHVCGIAAAALLALAACSKNSPAPTSPSAPASTTDSFSASIAQTSSVTHLFKVAANGQVTVTLTSVAPLSTMALGIGMMTSDGTNCITTTTQNDDARANTPALQGIAVAGNYCIRVYDSGNIPVSTSVTYTVTVAHP
jgi:hypothetical protein